MADISSTLSHDRLRSLVVFSIAGERYALNLPVVERVVHMVEVSPLPKAPVIVLGVINFHRQIIPVIDIRRRFGHSPGPYGLTSSLLVAQTSQRKLALPVDEVLGLREVAVENVSSPATVCPGIGLVVGIAALSDGVLFIHDLDAFLSLEEEQQLAHAFEGSPS